jgi:hypothetical protein
MGAPKLLTAKQVAPRVNRSDRTLQCWRNEGKGPRFIKYGNRIAYPEDLLEEWLAKKPRYRSTSEYSGGNPIAWCGLLSQMRTKRL